jgi:hypothetical protein
LLEIVKNGAQKAAWGRRDGRENYRKMRHKPRISLRSKNGGLSAPIDDQKTVRAQAAWGQDES